MLEALDYCHDAPELADDHVSVELFDDYAQDVGVALDVLVMALL